MPETAAIEAVVEQHRRMFGEVPQRTVSVPGRVNLMGEHTDYNEGFVLPTAIPQSTQVSASLELGGSGNISVHSSAFDEMAKRALEDTRAGHWSDYSVAAAREVPGLGAANVRLAIDSDVPHGKGLSSSAALLVAIIRVLSELRGIDRGDKNIALSAKEAENNYIGVPCGIMDQMAVAMASRGQALFLDARNLRTELVSLPSSTHVVVVDSGIRRELADGRYAQRREECRAAARALGVPSLRDADATSLRNSSLDSILMRRARHVVTENVRVQAAVQALQNDDAETLGELFTQSHVSQRDDFQVSTPAVDCIVDDAIGCGALGARQTGGGFGGCLAVLVPADRSDDWCDRFADRDNGAEVVAICGRNEEGTGKHG